MLDDASAVVVYPVPGLFVPATMVSLLRASDRFAEVTVSFTEVPLVGFAAVIDVGMVIDPSPAATLHTLEPSSLKVSSSEVADPPAVNVAMQFVPNVVVCAGLSTAVANTLAGDASNVKVPPLAIVNDRVNFTVNTGFDPLFNGLALVVTVEI